jgi:hypothetical protein
MFSKPKSERGAVLVHVALALTALLGFSALSIDYGVMWASRAQAQNAADAGALAGAAAMAFGAAADRTTAARVTADETASRNAVWGEAPGVVVTTPYTATCPGDPSGISCCRVDTFRNGANGSSALPTFFAKVINVQEQGVRAMAVAQAGIGNASDCLKPWAVIDKWQENWENGKPATAAWSQDANYDKYTKQGDLDSKVTAPDVYVAPTANDPGTGFRPFNADGSYTADYGREVSLKNGDNKDFQFGSGWFLPLALADSKGGKDYANNIKGCIGVTWKIGDELPVDTEPGNKVGPTRHAVMDDADSLYNQDPGARWDATANGGRGGIVGSAFAVSPRIVAVPLVDPEQIAEANKGGRTTVAIVNIMGFFVEGMDSKSVIGRLVTIPGLQIEEGGNSVGPESAFLMRISLIR